MSYEEVVAEHYLHGSLLNAIESSVHRLGKTPGTITIDDLAPVDEFHIGGRAATKNFMEQLNFSENHHILDVGCGLGGASRFAVDKFKSRVTGIDLTKEYVDTGNKLSTWVKMDSRIKLHHGSALSMPFDDNTFDGGFMMHVAMNIDDKSLLFKEIHRVLRPGAVFGVYDVMRVNEGHLSYPVPWAAETGTSKLAFPEQYKAALIEAGFEVSKINNRSDFALEFFKELKAKNEANGGPPPLGLHILMKDSTPVKVKNMIDNIAAGYIAPVEMITRKSRQKIN